MKVFPEIPEVTDFFLKTAKVFRNEKDGQSIN